jgi:DNA-binding CsgD family transcriptional regulator
MTRASVDLDRLNDAELGVLRLLAQGHTAKSIANALGSTPASVNERLREARRKTGVGSSRELARLLRAQENRHEQMGVGRSGTPTTISSRLDAEPWRPQMGVYAMLTFFLIAAAGAAALMLQAQPTNNSIDPLIGAPIVSVPDTAALHAKARREPRDLAWAARMETAIRERAMQIPVIGKNGNVLRVTCATTLCEIAGTITWPSPPPKVYDPKLPQNEAQRALQDAPFTDDLTKLGLNEVAGAFISGKTPSTSAFLLYWSRAAKPNANGAG